MLQIYTTAFGLDHLHAAYNEEGKVRTEATKEETTTARQLAARDMMEALRPFAQSSKIPVILQCRASLSLVRTVEKEILIGDEYDLVKEVRNLAEENPDVWRLTNGRLAALNPQYRGQRQDPIWVEPLISRHAAKLSERLAKKETFDPPDRIWFEAYILIVKEAVSPAFLKIRPELVSALLDLYSTIK